MKTSLVEPCHTHTVIMHLDVLLLLMNFGKEPAVTFEKKFDIDDLLKSVNTVKHATSKIYNVIAMCATGGFNLTKFTSNDGKRFTLNSLRNLGFWVINGNSVCKSIIFKCVMCKRLRGKLRTQ